MNYSSRSLPWLFALGWLTACSSSINLYSPANKLDQATQTNTPVLAWQPQEADSIQVWLDGIHMATVPGTARTYHPFPMGFGSHAWYIQAFLQGEMTKSPTKSFLIEDEPLASIPDDALLIRHDWFMQSSLTTSYAGEFLINNPTSWYRATVPTTVLTSLVRQGVYPDPYIGTNNVMIPDANDAFNQENNLLKYSHIPGKNPFSAPYWFWTRFEIPKQQGGKQIWLNFNEINYAADIWVNGQQIADRNEIKGMERRFRLDITQAAKVGGTNQVAVLIYPPDHVGKPSPPPLTPLQHPGRNMGEDPEIAKDYTKWDVLGWDWQPGIRDRDMGITEDVFVSFTGALDLRDPYISADLPLPDTTRADLTLEVTVEHLGNSPVQASIRGNIQALGYPDQLDFEQAITVNPGTNTFTFTQEDIPAFALENPHLWWPIHYGDPNLYELSLQVHVDGEVSDEQTLRFGIREVETYVGVPERVYKLNGKRIYPRGGNWVIDMLLTWNKARYKQELQFSQLANLNLQRVWGPTGVPPSCFFEAADELGIMIWQDFLNDFWGTQKHDPNLIPPEPLYRQASIDIIKKLRNHPSLVMWCGGNEGPNPREEMFLTELLPQYDARGGRHYLKNSLGDGLHGTGPYHTIRPKAYYTHPRLFGFSSELGPSGFPTEESLYRFLPNLGQTWEPDLFPIDGHWAYHDANNRELPDQRRYLSYDTLVRYDYHLIAATDSSGIADYAAKAQLVNYDTYRSVIERINHQLWTNSSGYAIWKYNSSWPSLVWQLYDWFLIPNAGLYAARRANKPLHIQLNRKDYSVALINTTTHSQTGKLQVTLFDTQLKQLWETADTLTVTADTVYNSPWQIPMTDEKELYFVQLKWLDMQGRTLADNFYWISENHDYAALNQLTTAEVTVQNLKREKEGTLTFRVQNFSDQLAFFTHFQLIDLGTGEEILPSFWQDNYISLMPGQSQAMHVSYNPRDVRGKLMLQYDGHNVLPVRIPLK